MNSRLEILTFHRISGLESPYFIPPMEISRKTFKTLLARLSESHKFMQLDDAVVAMKNRALPKRPLAITFDDGYLDNFEAGKDILRTMGIPATFFVPIYQIDSGDVYWWDFLKFIVSNDPKRFYDWLDKNLNNILKQSMPDKSLPLNFFCRRLVQILNQASFNIRNLFMDAVKKEFGPYGGPKLLMDWNDIKILLKEGFSIGSHSLSHEPLTDLDKEKAQAEIINSRHLLKERIGHEVTGFCYPRGAYTNNLAEMASQAGYLYAVTTSFGSNFPGDNPYTLARRNMSDFQGIRSNFPVIMHQLELTGWFDQILKRRRAG